MADVLVLNSTVAHLCDSELMEPVIGQRIQNDEVVLEYVTKHVKKVLSDMNIHDSHGKENLILKKYQEGHDLLSFSRIYAEKAHKFFLDHGVTGGDLVFFSGYHDEAEIVGMLKLDYKKGYVHNIEYDEEKLITKVHLHQSILPNASQKISDAIIFYVNKGFSKVLSRSCYIDGEKSTYMDKIFNVSMEASIAEKVERVEDAITEVISYYYDNDIRKSNAVGKCIAESIEETGTIDISDITEFVFDDKPEAKKAFVEKVEQAGIKDQVAVNKKVERKYAKKRVIVADNGIEIHVPVEKVNQNQFIEFQTTSDGKIQIMIKNIEKLEGK
jgi:hypothetical protein